MRTEEQIRERIMMAIVQEIQFTNGIAQRVEPETYIPRFIENLTNQIHEIVLDEIAIRKR